MVELGLSNVLDGILGYGASSHWNPRVNEAEFGASVAVKNVQATLERFLGLVRSFLLGQLATKLCSTWSCHTLQ